MKRWVILGIVVVGLSVAIPFAIALLPSESSGRGPVFPARRSNEPAGKAVVVEPLKHEFGTMAQQKTGEYSWTVKNVGKANLDLWKVSSSCACTIANFKSEGESMSLKPGEKTSIKLSWETKNKHGAFEQNAVIGTSDPDQPEIKLLISGTVKPAVVTIPEDRVIGLSRIASNEKHQVSGLLAAPDMPEMKVLKIECSNPKRMTASYKPLTPEEKSELNVQEGFHIDIDILPSQTLGAFQEEVWVDVDHPMVNRVVFLVGGKWVGPISSLPEAIRESRVLSSAGAVFPCMLSVLGQELTSFKVASKPDGIDVEISPKPSNTQGGKLRQYKMTVTLAQGAPAGIISGVIVLTSDHPQAGELRIPVQIGVEGG